MFGIFDFKDALNTLFSKNESVFECELSDLQNSKVAIDETSLSYNFTQKVNNLDQGMVLPYQTAVRNHFKHMKEANIDSTLVLSNNYWSNDKQYSEACNIEVRAYWKCFYFFILHYQIENEAERNSKLENDANVLNCIFSDYSTSHQINRFYEISQYNSLQQTGIECLRAPIFQENQMLWLYQNDLADAIMSSPMLFIHQNIDQIISSFDFKNKKIYIYDIKSFADHYKLSLEQMRECLFSLLCFFIKRIENGEKLKLIKALMKTHSEIVNVYKTEANKNINLIDDFLHKSAEKLALSSNKLDFMFDCFQRLNLSAADFHRFQEKFFTREIITDKNEILHYPFSFAENFKYSSFPKRLHEIIILYTKNLISDSIMFLLSSNFQNTYVFPLVHIQNFQTIKLKSTYLKNNFERSLFKLLSLSNFAPEENYFIISSMGIKLALQTENLSTISSNFWEMLNDEKFKTPDFEKPDFCDREIIKNVSKSEFLKNEFISIKIPQTDKIYSLYESLNLFSEAVDKKLEFITFDQNSVCTCSEISLCVNLMTLQELEYINIQKKKISRIGKALVCFGNEANFEKTLIVLKFIKLNIFDKKAEEQLMENFETFSSSSSENRIFKGQKNDSINSQHKTKELVEKMYKEGLFNTHKINSLESRVCIIDKQIYNLKTLLNNSELFDQIYSLIQDKYRHKIDFISKFFVLSWTEISIAGVADYECCLFFQKLNDIMLALYNIVSTNLALLVLKTETKKDISLPVRAFKKFPFIDGYSLEIGVLVKLVLTDYLIYKELVSRKHELSQTYINRLDSFYIDKTYNLPVDFLTILQKGFLFFIEFQKLGQVVFGVNQLTRNYSFIVDMNNSIDLFKDFFAHFVLEMAEVVVI